VIQTKPLHLAGGGANSREVEIPVAGDGHPRYLLKIRNTKTDKGRYFDTIWLKTDSKVLPEITIRVFGKIS
jgi:hypothetical protein